MLSKHTAIQGRLFDGALQVRLYLFNRNHFPSPGDRTGRQCLFNKWVLLQRQGLNHHRPRVRLWLYVRRYRRQLLHKQRRLALLQQQWRD